MTEKQYAEYLANLAELDINLDGDLSEQLYGYFQCFMPEGKGVEKVFEPLTKGKELYLRILPIYKITEQYTKELEEENLESGYFCPTSSSDTNELLNHGRAYVKNLKVFMSFLNDDEMIEMLDKVTEVVLEENEPHPEDNKLNEYLYDTISDWGLDNEVEEELLSVLSEAYYSINCNYYLSYYFQYPVLKNKPEIDFLEPYFKIWSLGYSCKFDGNKLILYR